MNPKHRAELLRLLPFKSLLALRTEVEQEINKRYNDETKIRL